MLILAAEMLFTQPQIISTQEQIETLPDNYYVSFIANISEIRQYGLGYMISFDNEFSCLADSPVSIGIIAKITGIIERYNNQTFIKAMKISKYDN